MWRLKLRQVVMSQGQERGGSIHTGERGESSLFGVGVESWLNRSPQMVSHQPAWALTHCAYCPRLSRPLLLILP